MTNLNITTSQQNEASIIGSALIDPKKISEMREFVRPEDFLCQSYGETWKEICAMESEGVAVDIVTIRNRMERSGSLELVGGISTIAATTDIAITSAGAVQYAKDVRDAADRRRLSNLCDSAKDEAESGELLRAKEMLASGAQDIGFFRSVKSIKQVLQESHSVDTGIGLELGYKQLDRIFGGGLGKTDMVIVAAGPSIGKTQFALNLSRTIQKDGRQARAMIVSLEMSDEQLGDRMVAMESDLPIGLCRAIRCKFASDSTFSRNIDHYREAVKNTATRPHFVYNAGSLTPEELRGAVASNINKIDCVILDYLQLMSSENPRATDYMRISAASRACKNMARQYKIPFIVLAQLSREGSKTTDAGTPAEPFLHHLRDSGQIEQDADSVLMLWREKREGVDVEQLRIYIRKNRQGALGSLDFSMRLKSGLIVDYNEHNSEDCDVL